MEDELKNNVLASSSPSPKKRRRRHIWVNPLLQNKTFKVIFQELRQDEVKFFNYFRMSVPTFDELLHRVQKQIQKQDTNMRKCIQPIEMLAVTLR